MTEVERMSPDLVLHENIDSIHMMVPSHFPQEQPRDLRIKRKLKPVPPPLDLSKRTLEPDQLTGLIASPRSPTAQKNLPLRKRALSWSSQPEAFGLQLPSDSGGCGANRSHIEPKFNHNSFPTSSSTSLKIHSLPTPQTPRTPHPHSAIPVITSRFNFGDGCPANANSSGCLQTANNSPLNLSTSSISALPSSLLSPAPSHPSSSSLNSSREELELESMNPEYVSVSHHNSPQNVNSANNATSLDYCILNLGSHHSSTVEQITERIHSPVIDVTMSPSPHNSHNWPTSVWSVFLAGVHIHFVLNHGEITQARLSEELGQLERSQHQQFAPHGLHLLRIFNDNTRPHPGQNSTPSYCQLYFRPVMVQQQDIMAIVPPEHPFYVRGKGWCSLLADQASERYDIPCQQLLEGDICLPSYHPEASSITSVAVVTPDLTDAMKRFDFNDDGYESSSGAYSAPPSATYTPHHYQRSVFLSPPASPSKKNFPYKGVIVNGQMLTNNSAADGMGVQKSRRPMNGFMLFAKQHRLKLIQQYPGKDNRAISCLLGTMWKALPEEERERFNSEARIQAEERKRIDPDCWKRKRSHSTS